MYELILYIDGLGVALFGIQAADKAEHVGPGGALVPIIIAVTTAIGGGLIRDVLAGRPTLLMNRELYATPVLIGCTLYVALVILVPEYQFVSAIACTLLIFLLLAAAIRWNLTAPDWLMTHLKGS